MRRSNFMARPYPVRSATLPTGRPAGTSSAERHTQSLRSDRMTSAVVEPPRPTPEEVERELAEHVRALAGPDAVPRAEQIAR